MIEDFTPSRIAFAGDWHGNISCAKHAMIEVREQGADCIVQLGDFGYWPWSEWGRHYIKAVSSRAVQYDMPVFWLDGNHEDHESLLAVEVDEKTGLRELAPALYHLPRGHRWTWGWVRFMALGGAASVDKCVRTPGVDWFPQEELTYGQAREAAESGEVDVLLTHDTIPFGNGYYVPNIPPDSFWPEEAMVRSHAHQQLIRMAADGTRPTHLFHGHFHSRYTANVRTDWADMLVVGLDCDGKTVAGNVMLLDLDDLDTDVAARRLREGTSD